MRHTTADVSRALLTAVTTDHAGGWRVPRAPRLAVDTAYLLVVVGLLAASDPAASRAVARTLAGIDG